MSKISIIPFLIFGFVLSESAQATRERGGLIEEHPEWLACESTSDCTTIKTGCYYWQPINKNFVNKVPASACGRSIPPGPQPFSRCKDKQCVNDPFSVNDWGRLESLQKFNLVRNGIEACEVAATPGKTAPADTTQISEYERVLDKRIREHQIPSNEELSTAVKAVVPCDDLISWEKGQDKWETLQAKNHSGRRVVVEQVRPSYSLDAIYPPLIQYAGILQGCANTFSMHSTDGSIWWGDFHADFTIDSSGHVDPTSIKPLFPGAAYMQKFMDCASAPFKTLEFPPPPKGTPIQGSVSIHFPYRDPALRDSPKTAVTE